MNFYTPFKFLLGILAVSHGQDTSGNNQLNSERYKALSSLTSGHEIRKDLHSLTNFFQELENIDPLILPTPTPNLAYLTRQLSHAAKSCHPIITQTRNDKVGYYWNIFIGQAAIDWIETVKNLITTSCNYVEFIGFAWGTETSEELNQIKDEIKLSNVFFGVCPDLTDIVNTNERITGDITWNS